MEIAANARAVIIEGGDSGLLRLASSRLCRAGGDKACLVCNTCRRVIEGIHPDVFVLEALTDKNGQQKQIPVEAARSLRADVFIRPFEGDAKVYIIKGAQAMNIQAQNALLKILEEPPEYASFILQTDSASALLPTIRSRCAFVRLTENVKLSPKAGERAGELLKAWRKNDELAVMRVVNPWSNLTRAELKETLEAFAGLLAAENTVSDRSVRAVNAAFDILAALESNTGLPLCCSGLCAKLS